VEGAGVVQVLTLAAWWCARAVTASLARLVVGIRHDKWLLSWLIAATSGGGTWPGGVACRWRGVLSARRRGAVNRGHGGCLLALGAMADGETGGGSCRTRRRRAAPAGGGGQLRGLAASLCDLSLELGTTGGSCRG